jgi:hypothetical protein
MDIANILSNDYRPASLRNFDIGKVALNDCHMTKLRHCDVDEQTTYSAANFYSDDSMANDSELPDGDAERESCSSSAVDGSSATRSKTASGRRRRRSLASRNLGEVELQILRQKINGRERQRMHDLNSALDGLREVRLEHGTYDDMRLTHNDPSCTYMTCIYGTVCAI